MAIGKKTGGGSRKGKPNKATAAREKAIEASGLTPLDFMLGAMRDDEQPINIRLDAAKAAAQYVHPKLSAVTVKGDEENPLHSISTITNDPIEAARIYQQVMSGEK
jgi:hypothetical protein